MDTETSDLIYDINHRLTIFAIEEKHLRARHLAASTIVILMKLMHVRDEIVQVVITGTCYMSTILHIDRGTFFLVGNK